MDQTKRDIGAPCRCTHTDRAHPYGGRCLFCQCVVFTDATTEHTADLRDLAVLALAPSKRSLSDNGAVEPFFLLRNHEGVICPFELPPGCGRALNIGLGKDLIFGMVREMVQELDIRAVVFVSDAWFGKATAKGRAMPPEEFLAATRERAFESALAAGLVDRAEALIVTVQTPVRTMVVNQFYDRDQEARQITYREITVVETGVDSFAGRMKMYGDLREENLG